MSHDTGAAAKGNASLWRPGAAVNGAWLLSDTRCSDTARNALPIESSALIHHASGLSRVEGWISGFGTAGDFVRIEYRTLVPDSVTANAGAAELVDSGYSRLCFHIDDPSADDGGRDTLAAGVNAPVCRVVERCSVGGSVRPGTGALTPSGSASARCSGAGLHVPLSVEQVASVLAAFPNWNQCGVRMRSAEPDRISSLAIMHEQVATPRVDP